MHQRPDHDSSEVKDYHCECRHNGPPPPPKDDMPLPEAADSKDMDDGMTMPDDYENMSVEKKMELMEEHRKHKENERCCRRHWYACALLNVHSFFHKLYDAYANTDDNDDGDDEYY